MLQPPPRYTLFTYTTLFQSCGKTLAGGETTVTIAGEGRGGRNQEFALASALSIDGVKNVVDLVEIYLDYKKKHNIARDIWFRLLSIPTGKEMEDVYKGIHDLKKKTRKQDALIREQEKMIKALKRKLQNVESVLPRKKPIAKSTAKRRVKSKAAAKGSKKAKKSKKIN